MRRLVRAFASLTACLCILLSVHPARAQFSIEPAFPHLTFDVPVDIQYAPDDSDRLFVVEREGIIRSFIRDEYVQSADVFLNIRDRVYSGVEEGLLGLAFHPEYDQNGRFFVYYTTQDPLRARLSSFRVSTIDPDAADTSSEQILLEIEQPYTGHNGGQVRFGPDGYLYVAIGDGGGHEGDLGTGEDLTTLFGSILRIDVDEIDVGRKYGIPPDNPFVGNEEGYREEIYAYGLRNPWRFSFDRDDYSLPDTGRTEALIWVADVGAGSFEEINIVEKGKNYGWSVMEGFRCLAFVECDTTGRTPPVWEYQHLDSTGRAVIGGFVYRGSELPTLSGRYVYGDYMSGRIWALTQDGEEEVLTEELVHADSLRIHTFGEDQDGELYFAAAADGHGAVYKLRAKIVSPSVEDETVPSAFHVSGNHPNPFRAETVISYTVLRAADVELSIFNALGQRVRTLVDAVQVPGKFTANWDGTDDGGGSLPAGVYFYRLSADGAGLTTGRMVYLR